MGWENQVICQIKGYVRAAYGEGALISGKINYNTIPKDTSLFLIC